MAIRRIASSVAALVFACAPAFAQVRSNAEIRQILADRVGPENQGVAIVDERTANTAATEAVW